MRSKERLKAKEIAREYFQKNIDNVSTGTEGFPDSSSFVYGFMEGYLCAKKEKNTEVDVDSRTAAILAWSVVVVFILSIFGLSYLVQQILQGH